MKGGAKEESTRRDRWPGRLAGWSCCGRLAALRRFAAARDSARLFVPATTYACTMLLILDQVVHPSGIATETFGVR
jgi:hypothetical protein